MIDIEQLLRKGLSLEDIAEIVTKETTAAQEKITKEKELKEHQNKREETIKGAREKAVTAFKEYFMLIAGTEVSEDIIRSAFVDIEESLEALNSIKITYNGKPFSIFEL